MNGHYTEIRIDELEYDPHNNRLPFDIRGKSQEKIEEYLILHESVEGIVESIAVNGLLPNMPLLVTRSPESAAYRVRDGNRRLLATKVFTDETLANQVLHRTARIANLSEHKPDSMYVFMVEDEEPPGVLGVAHITPPSWWSLLQRTNYITGLYDKAESETIEDRIASVAYATGLSHQGVLRSLNVFVMREHATENDNYGIELASRHFSISSLWQAIGSLAIQEFLGLRENYKTICLRDDPSRLNVNNLKELWRWLYGKRRGGDSSIVSGLDGGYDKLGAVLACPEALEALRETEDLLSAYRKTPDSFESFDHYIREATYYLTRAANYANGMTYECDGAGKLVSEAEQELLKVGQAVTKAKFAVTETEEELYARKQREKSHN